MGTLRPDERLQQVLIAHQQVEYEEKQFTQKCHTVFLKYGELPLSDASPLLYRCRPVR